MSNNVFIVNKPSGMTSFDVISVMRKHLKIKKMGHAGTLDPFATGVLLVCSGKFTRLADYFHAYPKTYKSRFKLGVSTDTDDITGTVTDSKPADHVTLSEIEQFFKTQQGTIYQQPPAISAKRVNGKRLYNANRDTVVLSAEPVQVTIHSTKVLGFNSPYLDVEIECSTGTYIRGIARDLGLALGCGAVAETLERTSIGPYSINNSCSLNNSFKPISHRAILPEIDSVILNKHMNKKLLSGSSISMDSVFLSGGHIKVFSPYFKELVAMCNVVSCTGETTIIKPEKVFI